VTYVTWEGQKCSHKDCTRDAVAVTIMDHDLQLPWCEEHSPVHAANPPVPIIRDRGKA
jgi:hypothetical protein